MDAKTLKQMVDSLGFGGECTNGDWEICRCIGGYSVRWGLGNYGMREHCTGALTFDQVCDYLQRRGVNLDGFKKGIDPCIFNGL